MSRPYAPGDPVVYHKTKYSPTPGPRAREVSPSPHGDNYGYVVDKYWLVKECRPDGVLVLITRRGKEHVIQEDNPNLRHANWWEKFVHRNRFPDLHSETEPVAENPASANS